MVSLGERTFIVDGIYENLRCDGRSRTDFRAITLETGLMPQCNGSCKLKASVDDLSTE